MSITEKTTRRRSAAGWSDRRRAAALASSLSLYLACVRRRARVLTESDQTRHLSQTRQRREDRLSTPSTAHRPSSSLSS